MGIGGGRITGFYFGDVGVLELCVLSSLGGVLTGSCFVSTGTAKWARDFSMSASMFSALVFCILPPLPTNQYNFTYSFSFISSSVKYTVKNLE